MLPEEKPGLAMIGGGCALPFITLPIAFMVYIVLEWLDGPAPNQGAMVMVGVAFFIAIAVGLCIIGVGAIVLVRSTQKWRAAQHNRPPTQPEVSTDDLESTPH